LELSLEFFVLIACDLELVVELSNLGGRESEVFLSVSDLISKLIVLIQEFLDFLSVSFRLSIIFSQPFLVLIKFIEKFLLLLGGESKIFLGSIKLLSKTVVLRNKLLDFSFKVLDLFGVLSKSFFVLIEFVHNLLCL
jgi:hypothetical protein